MSGRNMVEWFLRRRELPDSLEGSEVWADLKNPETDHGVIMVGPEVDRRVFEIVGRNHDCSIPHDVFFVTDSVEVLRILCARGFPLRHLARQLVAVVKENGKSETIYDLADLDCSRKLNGRGQSLRFVRRCETDSWEVRLMKE